MPRRMTAGEDPVKSARPSSEIDVDAILKLAAEADEAAKAEPEPKRRKRKEPKANGEAIAIEEPVLLQPDPEFVEMVKWGVGSGVELAKQKLDWSDPGIHWKEKVSTIIARLIQRLQPMQPGWKSDLVQLTGYSLLWAIPNVSAQRATKGQATLRDNGKREDSQNAGAAS